MFQHLPVPLDESEQAEQALPVAAHLARAWEGSMLLLEVVPLPIEFGPFWGDPPPLVQQAMRTDRAQAKSFLSRVVQIAPAMQVMRALAYRGQAHLHLLHVLPRVSARDRSASQEQKAGKNIYSE